MAADEGTLTVMFTDVESSTEYLMAHGDHATREVLREHERIIRDTAAECGGREIDDAGDGFLFVFSSARRAVSCAVEIQRRLHERAAAHDLRVRIGLNAGDVIDEQEKVYGSAVVATARIAGKAVGGQILVSDIVRQLAGSVSEAAFSEKGRFSLRGIPGRHRLYEVDWRKEESASAAPRASADPLLGRTWELEQLRVNLEAASSGGHRTIYLEGEAGIGKTRLTQEAARIALERGFKVYRGRAEELEQNRPFGPLLQALDCSVKSSDHRRAEIAEMLSVTTHAGQRGQQFRVSDMLAALLEDEQEPVLLIVEDVHWADPETLVTLRVIQRQLAAQPLAILANFRPLPRPPELDALLRADEPAAAHFRLAPLEREAVRGMVESILGTRAGDGLMEEVEGAGGNPLFVGELVHALSSEGAIDVKQGVAEVHEVELPPTLRLTILRRVGALPGETVEVLRLASILGSSFSLSDLATVSRRPSVGLLEPISKAVAAGILRDDGPRFAFRHDLLREAVYEDIPGPARSSLHREAASALESAGAPALQVAEHLVLGAERGDIEAARRIARGAYESMAASLKVAAALYEKALALLGPDDPERDEILAGYIMSLVWQGRGEEARPMIDDALSRPQPPEREASLLESRTDLLPANSEEILQAARVLGAHPGLDPERRLTYRLSALALELGQLQPGPFKIEVEGIAGEASEAGMRMVEAAAERVLVWLEMRHGSLPKALERADRAVMLTSDALQESPSDPWILAGYGGSLGIRTDALQVADRLDEALELTKYHIRRAEGLGAREYAAVILRDEACIEFRRGDIEQSWLLAETSLDALRSATPNSAAFALGNLALIAARRGRFADANRHIREFLAEWLPEKLEVPGMALSRTSTAFEMSWSRGLLAESSGDVSAAMGHYQDAVVGFAFCEEPAADLVKLALATGERAVADGVIGKVRARVAHGDTPRRSGLLLRLEGLAANDAERLLSAVEMYREAPRPLETAWAAEDAADMVAQRGDLQLARDLFREAIDAYEERGLAWDVARSAARMRKHGIQRGGRSPRSRPSSGWESLTPAELEVASLIGEGLSNPEIAQRLFVSRQTVKSHLAHIFSKLGVSSRAELAAQVARRPA